MGGSVVGALLMFCLCTLCAVFAVRVRARADVGRGWGPRTEGHDAAPHHPCRMMAHGQQKPHSLCRRLANRVLPLPWKPQKQNEWECVLSLRLVVCVRACTYACMFACLPVCACARACVYMRMRVCGAGLLACMHLRACVCMRARARVRARMCGGNVCNASGVDTG